MQELNDLDLENVCAGASGTAKGLTCSAACAACSLCKAQKLGPNDRPTMRANKRNRTSKVASKKR